MRLLFLSFLALMFVLASANSTFACSCLAGPTVQDELARYENVFVGQLERFEEAGIMYFGKPSTGTAGVLIVEKVYKGGFREKQAIKVFDGGGGDCTGGFPDDAFGERFLLYVNTPKNTTATASTHYSYSICSRSDNVKDAKQDLVFLDSLEELSRKTRLSGYVRAYGENIALPDLAEISVRITKGSFERELKLDKDGFFDFWDLPVGKYEMSFDKPPGWKLEYARIIPPKGYSGESKLSKDKFVFMVDAGRHVEFLAHLKIDNEISGTVLSPTGVPMEDVCVSAEWLNPNSDSYRIPHNCTDKNGKFSISELPPGKYRLEVNTFGRITPATPFESFYYPNTVNKEEAETFVVDKGKSVKGVEIQVAKTLPLITIKGQFVLKDGGPVADERIEFKPVDDDRYETVRVETDENGYFSFQIPVGAKGELKANSNIAVSRFDNCKQALLLRKTRIGRLADIQTNVIRIDASAPLDNLRLIYPLACK